MAQKNKLYYAMAILAVVLIVSVIIVWKVLFVQLAAAKEQYIQNRLELGQIEQRVVLKSVFKKELEGLGKDKELLENSLTSAEDTLVFIETLESIAIYTNNIYELNTVEDIKDNNGNIIAKNFNVRIVGTFSNLITFMQELKFLPYLLNFAQATITQTLEGQIETTATIQLYIK
jgi:Tfp pilus assembly protein PilO